MSPTGGIELGMPRDGWYAVGIEHDANRRWAESYRAYVQAYARYQRELTRRPAWARLIGDWLAKAKFQMIQSSRLLSLRHVLKGMTSSVERLHDRANVLHNKWLAIRAFTGRAVRKLSTEAVHNYRRALDLRPGHQAARLGLAALLHELGRDNDARSEFQKVIRPLPSYLDLDRAHYHSAAGDAVTALRLLHSALRSPSLRKEVNASNDFDRLRPVPAFRRLLGL